MSIQFWYNRYESQCWYSNTFLINNVKQISRAIGGDREWNNVMDSGCNFTCLAMILGINPAYLASELKKKKFFRADKSIKSKYLSGRKGSLVWDRNKPNKNSSVSLRNILIPGFCVKSFTLKMVDQKFTLDVDEANDIINRAHTQKLHIICGYDDHSRVVAGKRDREYFLWDPDLNSTKLRKNLDGDYTIRWFYNAYKRDTVYSKQKAEFNLYEVKYF